MSGEYFKTSEILGNAKIDGGLRKRGIFKKNKKDQPLLTIITAVLNNEKYLEESITSLQNQKYKNYEHIIIDGGSTDNTLKIIITYSAASVNNATLTLIFDGIGNVYVNQGVIL